MVHGSSGYLKYFIIRRKDRELYVLKCQIKQEL